MLNKWTVGISLLIVGLGVAAIGAWVPSVKKLHHKPKADSTPDDWRVVLLGEVADITFSNVDKKTVTGEVPVKLCNYTDVFYNRRIRSDMEFMIATATQVECERWNLRQGDVLFTKDSETVQEIGIPTFVTEDMPGVLCGYHLGLARPDADLVEGAFLAEALASPATGRQFGRIANGVTRFGLTLDATRALPILLPPLPEQRAIAAVLDSIDEAIERTEAVVAATEHLRDVLLHELLTRGGPGCHSEWKEAPDIGTIPACWDVVRLGDAIADGPTNGIYKPASEYGTGTWLIRIDDFVAGALTRQDGFERIRVSDEESEHYAIYSGDVLINRVNSLSHLGKAVLIPELAESTLFESNMMRLRMCSEVEPGFAMILLLSRYARRYFISRAKKAVQQASINQQDVTLLPIPLPGNRERTAILETSVALNDRILRDGTALERLKALKASAADALLTGRVRAPSGKD